MYLLFADEGNLTRQRESNGVKTTERSEPNEPYDHHELGETYMWKSVSWLSYCMLIDNLLAVCSRMGDCEICQREALLPGFGFWKWNGNCCVLLLYWKELWASCWTSHLHWEWTVLMPRNSLPAILHRWDRTFLSRHLTENEKKKFLGSVENLEL